MLERTKRIIGYSLGLLLLGGLFAVLVLSGGAATANRINDTCAGGTPPVNGYSCGPTTRNYITATQPINLAALRGDGDEGVISTTLPLSFNYFDCTTIPVSGTISILTNGFLQFGSYGQTFNWPQQPIPYQGAPGDAIFGLWADLDLRTSGGIYTDVVGTAPNRKFVVEWRNVGFFNGTTNERVQAQAGKAARPFSLHSTGQASFEIVLEEGTNLITVNYGTVDAGNYRGGAVAGLSHYVYDNPQRAYQYSYTTGTGTNSLSNSAVAYTPGGCLPEAPLTPQKSDGQNFVQPGQQVTYTLHAELLQQPRSGSIIFTDTIPNQITGAGCDAGVGNTCTISGGQAVYTVSGNPLSNYQNVTLTGRVATTITTGSLITNSMLVNLRPSEPTPYAPVEATDVDAVLIPPLVAITVTDGLTEVQRGQLYTYTISYANYDTATVNNLGITSYLPTNSTFIGCSDRTGNVYICQSDPCGYSNAVYFTQRPPLRVGEVNTVTISLRAGYFLSTTALLTNTTWLFSNEEKYHYLSLATATDVDSLRVPNLPILLVDKSDDTYMVRPNERITYTLAYTNIGGAPAYSTTLLDSLPTFLTNTVCNTRGLGTCTVGSFNGSPTASFNISSTVGQLGGGYVLLGGTVVTPTDLTNLTLTNRLAAGYRTAAGGGGDLLTSPEATDVDQIVIPPSFAVGKSDGVRYVSPGQTLTYTIATTNTGIVAVNRTTIGLEDRLPFNTTYQSCSVGLPNAHCTYTPPYFSYGYRYPGFVNFFLNDALTPTQFLPGQSFSVSLTLAVNLTATNGLTIPNLVNVYTGYYYDAEARAVDNDVVEIGGPNNCTRGFLDVPEENIFHDPITFLVCRSVVDGYPAGGVGSYLFQPNGYTTRGQFAKIAVRSFNVAPYTPTVQTFNDVPSSYIFYPYIEAAAHAELMAGFPGGGFRPGAEITRGQVAKVIKLARQYPDLTPSYGPVYTDVPTDNPFYTAINTLSLIGVVSGAPCTTVGPGTPTPYPGSGPQCFRPNASIRRGEMAKVISNGINYNVPSYYTTPTVTP